MSMKSDAGNRVQNDLERAVSMNTLHHLPDPEREHDGRRHIPLGKLDRLTASEAAYLDYVARVIRRYS